MRLPRCLPLVVVLSAACGSGKAPGACTRDRDCPAGEGCVSGTCAALPCGGCQPEEACNTTSQKCEPAQGATCSDHACPAAAPCNGLVCAAPCGTSDSDCPSGLHCSNHSCVQCLSDTQCDGVSGKPRCDLTSGSCVQCNTDFQCVTALGAGHYCDAHACKPGCKADANCDTTKGETCDTSTTPGRCIQCRTAQDCNGNPGASACDDTGHCVECYGTSPDTAKTYCGGTKPECDLASKTCVPCLPAHDGDGADCGYLTSSGRQTNDNETCSGATHTCVDGCQTDAQCGCLPVKDQNGFITRLDCTGAEDRAHCDPNRTQQAGFTSAVLGACVQCLTNADCHYEVTNHGWNGARCDKRTGTTYETCQPGCDTDADCPGSKICHLGQPGDPNNNKCVDCVCDNPGADGTYCETTLAGAAACPGLDASNNLAKVCDKDTLLCRKRRQNEECLDNAQCGDLNDPQVDPSCKANIASSVCVFGASGQTGGQKFCAADHQTGRCGIACDGLPGEAWCSASTSTACPNGSICKGTGSGNYCTANSCSYP